MERVARDRSYAACFFSPPGRRSRQRDEGARVEIFGNVAPSSDPSGHLLPGGEKKDAATLVIILQAYP
jgi:hypothetical protein